MPLQAARASRAVLITRPEPGAAETAQALAALGWDPVLAPALTLAALPFKPPPSCQALVITSRAAARALPASALSVIAVGEATATEARARGFGGVEAAAGDAALDLGPEMADEALDRPGGGVAQSTDGVAFDLIRKLLQHVDFSKVSVSYFHALKHVNHPAGTLATWCALTA